MASVISESTPLRAVRASVQFTIDTGETPVSVVQELGHGADRRSGTYEKRDIAIRDARPIADTLDLDVQGFVLRRFPTAVKDFYDADEVRAVYYPEIEELVAQATGASKVLVFDHTLRVDDAERADALKVRAPVRNMHNDFTEKSAPQRVRDLLPADEAEARLKKRFGSINVWRPIVSPVETAPLAICEWGSLSDRNLIPAERRYKDRLGGVLHLSYNPDQRWYYFPRMTRDEVILLKCYDSKAGVAKWTCHGSFDDPDTPEGAAPRESIEIRTLYFFGE